MPNAVVKIKKADGSLEEIVLNVDLVNRVVLALAKAAEAQANAEQAQSTAEAAQTAAEQAQTAASAADGKVSKGGDVMTGALQITAEHPCLAFRTTNVDAAETQRASNTYKSFLEFKDKNDFRTFFLQGQFFNPSGYTMTLGARKVKDSQEQYAALNVGFAYNGTPFTRATTPPAENADNKDIVNVEYANAKYVKKTGDVMTGDLKTYKQLIFVNNNYEIGSDVESSSSNSIIFEDKNLSATGLVQTYVEATDDSVITFLEAMNRSAPGAAKNIMSLSLRAYKDGSCAAFLNHHTPDNANSGQIVTAARAITKNSDGLVHQDVILASGQRYRNYIDTSGTQYFYNVYTATDPATSEVLMNIQLQKWNSGMMGVAFSAAKLVNGKTLYSNCHLKFDSQNRPYLEASPTFDEAPDVAAVTKGWAYNKFLQKTIQGAKPYFTLKNTEYTAGTVPTAPTYAYITFLESTNKMMGQLISRQETDGSHKTSTLKHALFRMCKKKVRLMTAKGGCHGVTVQGYSDY